MRLTTLLFLIATASHAQTLEATYSVMAESVMRTISGGKSLPRGLGGLYVSACAEGGTFETSDSILMKHSPVAAQPPRQAVATISEHRYRANRPLRWSRDFVGLALVGAAVWAGNGGGDFARGLRNASGIITPALSYADNKMNRLAKDPDYSELLDPRGPTFLLKPSACREGFFFVKFDRGFNKQDVVISRKPLAAFEMSSSISY